MRGANPADTGAFIDTLNVPQLYHFLVGPSVVSANLVEKLDFFPGGFGARYGRFSGGLVDVTLRNDFGHEVHGAVDVNALDSSIFFEGPVGKGWRVAASVRRSYIDALLPLFIPKKVGSSFVTVVPVYYDYQARAEHDLRAGGKLVLEAFGSDDSLGVVAQDPARKIDLDQHTGSHRLMATWTASAGRWVSVLRPSYGYGVQSFALGSNGGELRYHRLYLREDLTRAFSPRFTFAAGFDGLLSYDLADFDVPAPRDGRSVGVTDPVQTLLTRRLVDTAPSVYAEGQWTPVPSFALCVPGLRFDYLTTSSARTSGTSTHASPRAGPCAAAPRAQGHRGPVPPAPHAAVPRRGVRQPQPRAHLGRSVRARRRAALHGGGEPVAHGVLRATARPARAVDRSLLQHGAGARLRARGAAAPRGHRALLRLDRLHALALRDEGEPGRGRSHGTAGRHEPQRR